MTVKELKNALQGMSESIDRIAGFCDNYDQMFDRCEINVLEHFVQINVVEDLFEPQNIKSVPDSIAEFLALPEKVDDFIVIYEGSDNQDENTIMSRTIKKIVVVRGSTGVGISLQGSELGELDSDIYVTKIFIKGERINSLNSLFWDFVECNSTYKDGVYVEDVDDGVFIKFSSYEAQSSAIIAMLASIFKDMLFCHTPMIMNQEVSYRLTNDHEGECWGPFAAVFIPADNRDCKWSKCSNVYVVDEMVYLKEECCTMEEVDEFLAKHNPDLRVGDMVARIVSRYIDSPQDLILKPCEDDLE